MRFIFNGTLDELKETIHLKAKEYNKDIVVYDNEPNVLEIGFQRLGHSGGRFFIANVTVQNEIVILNGETKNIFQNTHKSKIGYLWSEFISYMFAYIILEIILLIPWLFLRNIVSVWIPLVLPIIYLVIRSFLNKKAEKEDDRQFADFMSMFTTYTDIETELYQPSWDDVYKKPDLARGKFQSIRDDDEDMLLITYEDGMKIDVGYIKEYRTYYITVVQDDTIESWNKPLGVYKIKDKINLSSELQNAIYKFRNV